MAKEKAEESEAPKKDAVTLRAEELFVPDEKDCSYVIVMNHRKGTFSCSHSVPMPNRQPSKSRVMQEYRVVTVKLRPGLNLAPKEWIAALKKFNPGYAKACGPDGFVDVIGSSKDWLKIRKRAAVQYVVNSGDLKTLENLKEVEERAEVIAALDDEIEARRKDNRISEEVLREQRRAKRRNENNF